MFASQAITAERAIALGSMLAMADALVRQPTDEPLSRLMATTGASLCSENANGTPFVLATAPLELSCTLALRRRALATYFDWRAQPPPGDPRAFDWRAVESRTAAPEPAPTRPARPRTAAAAARVPPPPPPPPSLASDEAEEEEGDGESYPQRGLFDFD